jgi:xanthine dehydrogenase accessory factor
VDWLQPVEYLREHRRPGVLVTLAAVRGHAPREAGAKMVVAADRTWGTIGGGNLEALAVDRARLLLQDGRRTPETLTVSLSEKAPSAYGVQCCGGEVTVLLEPLPVSPAVAIFGMGHVGLELARILARHDLELHLVDTRPDQLSHERLAVLADARARIHVHRDVPVLPEIVLPELPPGTHVLIMTHDHAEDAALCDAALRSPALGSIGLIGSAAKWGRFRQRLAAEGHAPEAIDRITTPIGLDGIRGKDPATIALSVAAALVLTFERDGERDRADAGNAQPARR